MAEPASPSNNLILRQMEGVRRDVREMHEREARVIELLNRMNGRLDDFRSSVDKGFAEVRSDS